MASHPQAAPVSPSVQNRVEAEHSPGLLDIRSGPAVRKPPDFALFRAAKLSWELTEGHQGPAGSDHVLRPLLWPVVRGSSRQMTDVCPQTLRKGWLSQPSWLCFGDRIRPVSSPEEGLHGGWRECGASWLFPGGFGTVGESRQGTFLWRQN